MSDATQQEQLDKLVSMSLPLQGLEPPAARPRPVYRVGDLVDHNMHGECVVTAVEQLEPFPVYALRDLRTRAVFRSTIVYLS